ncbi:MAG: RIP metalloprotease RseP [Bacillota bacterium]
MEMLKIVLYIFCMFFLVVAVHEWGHYYFAQRAGILVREFAIGFGPKIFSYKRKETQFTFRLLPFGGFARMAGEDPELVQIEPGQRIGVKVLDGLVRKIYVDELTNPKNVIFGEVVHIDLEEQLCIELNVEGDSLKFQVDPQAIVVNKKIGTQIAPKNRQYASKTVGQRALAIFAGPLMNFILAFLLFGVYVQMTGVPVDNPTYIQVGEVTQGKPADIAGLKKGDIISTINGVSVHGDQVNMINIITQSKGVPMKWVILRNNQKMNLTVTPRAIEGQEGGKVGIALVLPTRSAGFLETFKMSGKYTFETSKLIFSGLHQIVQNFSLNDLGGPVRTIEETGKIAKSGIEKMIFWTAMISINLGIFNLLPIPALDGSRLVFLGIEAVRGRPVDPSREGMVHFVGFAMLFLLMIAVTYNDILRLING